MDDRTSSSRRARPRHRTSIANDVVVLLEQGLLRVRLDDQEFVLKRSGGIWAFPKGPPSPATTRAPTSAVLRVIDLLPGL